MNTNRAPHKRIAFLIIAVALVLAGASFLLPVASTADNPTASHWRFALAMTFLVLFAGPAIWFWKGLLRFKTSLRVAYVLLGLGLIGVAVATVQLPIIGLLDQWDSLWAAGGGLVIIFLIGTILMYLGARKLALLLKQKGVAASIWLVSVMSLVVAGLSYVAAITFVTHDTKDIEIYIAICGLCAGYLFFAGMLTQRVLNIVGDAYHNAMRALAVAFYVFAFAALQEGIGSIFMDAEHSYQVYGAYILPFTISGLFFVWASYEFSLLTAGSLADEPQQDRDVKIADADYIESIVAVAALASQRAAVDPITDGLREVTAALSPGSQLTEPQKRKLVDVYHRLEKYLMNDDPARTYTKEEIREQASAGFNAVLGKNG